MADGEAKYARMYDIRTRLKSLSRDDWDTEEIAADALAEIERLRAALREILEPRNGMPADQLIASRQIAREALDE